MQMPPPSSLFSTPRGLNEKAYGKSFRGDTGAYSRPLDTGVRQTIRTSVPATSPTAVYSQRQYRRHAPRIAKQAGFRQQGRVTGSLNPLHWRELTRGRPHCRAHFPTHPSTRPVQKAAILRKAMHRERPMRRCPSLCSTGCVVTRPDVRPTGTAGTIHQR